MMLESVIASGSYDSMSFSSKEDIYELIWYYDTVRSAADRGIEDAMVVIIDLDRLINSCNRVVSMDRIKDCIKIQLGVVDISEDNLGEDLLVKLSELRDENLIKLEEKLEEEVNEVVRLSNYYWSRSLERKKVKDEVATQNYSESCDDYWELDRSIKEGNQIELNKSIEVPSELTSMEKLYEEVSSKLAKLRNIKDRTREQQDEMNKLIRYIVSLTEDIRIMKDSYNVPYSVNELTPRRSNAPVVSYVSNMHDLEIDDRDYDSTEFISEWQVNKIRYLCQEILTPRQLLYFEMHYIEGVSQGVIGRMVSRDRTSISRTLDLALTNIKDYLSQGGLV